MCLDISLTQCVRNCFGHSTAQHHRHSSHSTLAAHTRVTTPTTWAFGPRTIRRSYEVIAQWVCKQSNEGIGQGGRPTLDALVASVALRVTLQRRFSNLYLSSWWHLCILSESLRFVVAQRVQPPVERATWFTKLRPDSVHFRIHPHTARRRLPRCILSLLPLRSLLRCEPSLQARRDPILAE